MRSPRATGLPPGVQPAKRSRRWWVRTAFWGSAKFLTIAGVLTVVLAPVVWIVLTSLKPEREWLNDPPIWIPSTLEFSNYSAMWAAGGGSSLLNSLVIVCTATVLAVVIGTLAAYSISRFGTGGPRLANWILSIKFLPPVVFAVPLLIMLNNVGMVSTYRGMILLYTAFHLPFVVWMMKGFFDEIPPELEEAARVDGCSWWLTFRRVSLPVVRPSLVSTTLLTFIFGWTELFVALVFTRQERFTLPVQLSAFFSERTGLEWGPQAALSVTAIVPIVLFSFMIQQHLIRGMTFGAVKQ